MALKQGAFRTSNAAVVYSGSNELSPTLGMPCNAAASGRVVGGSSWASEGSVVSRNASFVSARMTSVGISATACADNAFRLIPFSYVCPKPVLASDYLFVFRFREKKMAH